jgi:hypothetical protein
MRLSSEEKRLSPKTKYVPGGTSVHKPPLFGSSRFPYSSMQSPGIPTSLLITKGCCGVTAFSINTSFLRSCLQIIERGIVRTRDESPMVGLMLVPSTL